MAARIAGVTLPPNKHISVALTAIYGIGLFHSNNILRKAEIAPNIKTKDLSDIEINKIREIVEKEVRVEGDLRREISGNIKRLREIQCYRGIRHARRLPVRGQRTKTNSRTIRGNVRRTMGSGRAKSAQKT